MNADPLSSTTAQPMPTVRVSPIAIDAVRSFFSWNTDRDFIPSWVAAECGLPPFDTLVALAYLLEAGEISANVRGSSLYWTFSKKGRA